MKTDPRKDRSFASEHACSKATHVWLSVRCITHWPLGPGEAGLEWLERQERGPGLVLCPVGPASSFSQGSDIQKGHEYDWHTRGHWLLGQRRHSGCSEKYVCVPLKF